MDISSMIYTFDVVGVGFFTGSAAMLLGTVNKFLRPVSCGRERLGERWSIKYANNTFTDHYMTEEEAKRTVEDINKNGFGLRRTACMLNSQGKRLHFR